MRQIDVRVVVDLIAAPEHAGQFALFMGAGCSAGAGIPTADGITREAKYRLYRMHHRDDAASYDQVELWLSEEGLVQSPDTAYSDILELIRPTPRLRRTFLEPFFVNQKPSPAHWALAKVVEARVIKDLYTANFDTLIEQSAGQLTTLRVVSYDEQVAGTGDFESQPTLYKLHGDYLFDRLANTQGELRHLGASQAAKLQRACAQGGLVVVGYSGRDHSIMEVLTAAARAGVPLGLYWLARRGDPVASMVQDLMESSTSCHIAYIEGFDDFAAALNNAITRTRSTIRVERALTDNREPFVAHKDGVQTLIEKLSSALAAPQSSVVCLSGLPGVGKTATARRVVAQIVARYTGHALISGKDRVLTVSDIVDECHLQLPIRNPNPDSMDRSIEHLLSHLETVPTLLLLDNLDGVHSSVIDFLADLPPPSRALVTMRDARDVRYRIPHLWEIEHTGLTRDEMAELLSLWVQRSPVLGRKIGNARPEDVERLLVASNGWPEAMVMLLSTLSNTLLHIDEIDETVQGGIYEFLLGGLYSRLSRPAKSCLVWSGSFPVTFTLDGLASVSKMKRSTVERAIEMLLDAHLVKELFIGQYTWAHPIVREYVARKARRYDREGERRHAVQAYLENWARQYGGQPTSDWSNFLHLDKEFENLKRLMANAFEQDDLRSVTSIYRWLFSYIVERGYWTFTESWCERMVARSLRQADLADWLIWWSWIKFYLRRDFSDSASLAERALSLNPRENRLRFQAHRRALVAHGRLGNERDVADHRRAAAEICARAWSSDSDEAIDLMNSEGSAWLALGQASANDGLIEKAIGVFERAERVSRRRSEPNTREIGVAMLGQASCLAALGQDEQGLELAQGSLAYAWRVSWLRGIAEANELVAELAERLNRKDLAQSARDVAERMGSQLRSAPAVVAEAS